MKLIICALLLLLLMFHLKTGAQVTKFQPVTIIGANQNLVVLNYSDFKKTSLYATRIKLYGATFNNPSKSFSMTDGTSLNISFIKNPSFANQANAVTPTLYTGPVHGAPNNVPVQAVTESDQGWTCNGYTALDRATSVNFSVTDYNQQMPYIYPGAVFTFDNFMNGSLQPPSGARNPIVIATDHSTSNNFVQVANPAQTTVQNTVYGMVSHFIGSGNISTNYKYYESNNIADWAIKVNTGSGNLGSAINTTFNTTDRRHHRYITIDVTKQLYSIFTNPPSNGFYSVTNSTEATPNLMVVGSVNYGVRLLVNMELTFATNADAVAFNNEFSYLAYSGSLDMNYLQSHSSEITNISSYEIGGPNTGTAFVNSNNLQSNINNILSGVTNQNAKPVNYQLYDMAWDMIGASASTGYFSYENCVPAIPTPPNPVLSSATLTVHCGSDGKNKSSWTIMSFGTAAAMSSASENGKMKYSEGDQAPENEWPANQTVTFPFLWTTSTHPYLNDFTNGGKVAFEIYNTGLTVSNDDIKNFSLTINMTFTISSQNYSKTYNLTWSGLNYSTGHGSGELANGGYGPTVTLYFKYSNGTFITSNTQNY